MKMPKVSIIIPVHNAATTLELCIDSIMAQNYSNIECILIENNSEDTSEVICRKYAEKYKTIRVEISVHRGVSAARNLGLSVATGDIIGFCDADDFMEPNALKTIVSEFMNNPDIIGVIGAFYVGQQLENGIQKKYRGLKNKRISTIEAISYTIASNSVMGSVWNKYYKAEILKDICFDTTLSHCEDMHFNIVALSNVPINKSILLIDNPLYCYMQNNLSVTHQAVNFFDADGNLKYINALNKIEKDCSLHKKCKNIVRMKKASFAIDYYRYTYKNEIARQKLLNDLKNNYFSLLFNITKYNMKSNLKRVCKGLIILVSSKLKK